MRLGVLDVGSNTVHLLVVDAHRGGHPTPMSSTKATLRLAEAIDGSGKLTRKGADKLISTIDEFAKIAASSGCAELMAFATSAVRDAKNSDDVLARVPPETGVELQVLAGVDESRLTFLAVRRWYGWSAGRIINLDIGGGSLELSSGVDEEPEVALSLPLGAGRLTREWLPDDPPGRRRVAMLRDWLDAELAEASAAVLKRRRARSRGGDVEDVPLAGAAHRCGAVGRRTAGEEDTDANGLRQLIAFISRMTAADRAELEGVSAERAPQIVAGALVAEASMRALSIETVDICPWALREGLILRKLDSEADGTALVETPVRDAGRQAGVQIGSRTTPIERQQTMTGPDDSQADTRPISVAELLAKNGTIGAPPVGGRRRRRRGNSDAVTVAELTGEIPIIRTGSPAIIDIDHDEDEPESPAAPVQQARATEQRTAPPAVTAQSRWQRQSRRQSQRQWQACA